MGRRIHGTERKVRHTITIDGDLVRRACAYGDAIRNNFISSMKRERLRYY